ncbi:MAG: tRNA (N6-threonylcarbamoyladenosine(37)-N6)-methyltransferase TrmO [Thermoleophilia bacterium]
MTETDSYAFDPIGVVRSPLRRREDCPSQGYEGAPDAWLLIAERFIEALDGIVPGHELVVLTWLHEAQRDTLKTHPRGNECNPLRGVFATRSPNRPNPIGLHRVTVLDLDGHGGIHVRPLEALDGTPIIDIKPVLDDQRGQ